MRSPVLIGGLAKLRLCIVRRRRALAVRMISIEAQILDAVLQGQTIAFNNSCTEAAIVRANGWYFVPYRVGYGDIDGIGVVMGWRAMIKHPRSIS